MGFFMQQTFLESTRETEKSEKNVTRIFKALGTVNSIHVPCCIDKGTVDLAVERVNEIDDRMSVFKQNSDIYRVNYNSGASFFPVHTDTFELIKKAAFFSALSEGAFDVTVSPLIELWGIGRKVISVPETDDIEDARSLTDYKSIIIDEENLSVMLKKRGQRIDLGGIAKGYAADEVKRILLEHGIKNAIINLGGNVVAIGMSPANENWIIGIQNPFAQTGAFIGTVDLKDETAVTSGLNEKYFIRDGIRYHHIIDPRTGMPADTGIASVTVIGGCSADMDGLSTAVFVLGIEKGINMIRKLGAEALIIGTSGSVLITEGLKSRFRFMYALKSFSGDPLFKNSDNSGTYGVVL
jgi:FAD:protein FMN transferase